MKIRIESDQYKDIIKAIRQRVKNNEFDTWSFVLFTPEHGKPRGRITHTPKGDDQYQMIQLGFWGPAKEDSALGIQYVDIIPKLEEGAELSDKEFTQKAGVVLGRMCELLNNHFEQISEYKVYTK